MKYEIRLASNNDYYFVLKARNGEITATSEMYKSKQACKDGISSVKKSWFAKVIDYAKH